MADKVEKLAISIVVFVLLLGACLFGLLGWGFVEIVQWLTSK